MGGRAVWVDSSSCTYERTSGLHLLTGLTAAAESRVPVKKRTRNMAIAKALQFEAARRRAVPIRFNVSPVASLKSLSLSIAVLERIYFSYITLR